MRTRSYPVALLALVLWAAGCSSGGGKQSTPTSSASTRHLSATAPVLRHASLVGCHCTPGLRLSFDYPQSLDVDPIHVDEHYTQIVGYVSNRKLHYPCRTLPNGGECGMPLDRLSNDGVLVEWSFHTSMGGGIGNPVRETPGTHTVVNGRPEVTNSSTSSECTQLGRNVRTVTAVIGLTGSATLDMLACLGPGALSEESAVSAMLRSVRVNSE